jgi:ferredoxin
MQHWARCRHSSEIGPHLLIHAQRLNGCAHIRTNIYPEEFQIARTEWRDSAGHAIMPALLEVSLNKSTISPDRVANLRKLAVLMNTRHKNPFPVSEELLSCFDIALTPEENDFLLKLGTEPYTYEKAASLTSLTESQFQEFFTGLLRKGFVWEHESDDGREWFMLPGMMVGWFEVFLSSGDESPQRQEFSRRMDVLLKSFGKLNVFPVRALFNFRVRKSGPHQSILAPGSPPERGKGQTIAVGKSIDSEPPKVYPARTVEELIEKYGDGQNIAVVHCFCRQFHKMIDEPCRFNHPPESCIAMGSLARYAARHGMARYLSKSEAISLIRELQTKGAVHQVFHKDENIGNPEIAICNCCWDCCGVFGSYNRGILPLSFHCYYEAKLPDVSLCTGCATCEEYCPVRAISIEDDKCRVESKKCIGCGQCEIHCPGNAIQLFANERTVFLPLRPKSEARIKS